MKVDGVERGRDDDTGALGASLPVERRLEAAEQRCRVLEQRVGILEREREHLRARLEAILQLLDGAGLR